MFLHSWKSPIWNKHKIIPWSSPVCANLMNIAGYVVSGTKFFSRLMLHKRRRFWRPDRLLILFEDKSRTCRLLRFSNPSITFSWFPLLMQRERRTYLQWQGHDTHEYTCTHKEFYFTHSHWFLLINIKGAMVALWGASTSSPQCWVEWQACLYLLHPDRWGLTAQQMLRCYHSTPTNKTTGPELSTLVRVPRLLLTLFHWLKLLSSCLAKPHPALAKHAPQQRAAVSGGGWRSWSHEALGQCCDGLWNRLPDRPVLFREAACVEEGSRMGLDGRWVDKVWVCGGWATGPKPKAQAGRESESSDKEVTGTQVPPPPTHTHTEISVNRDPLLDHMVILTHYSDTSLQIKKM